MYAQQQDLIKELQKIKELRSQEDNNQSDIKELSEIPYMFNNEDRFVKVIKNGNVIN